MNPIRIATRKSKLALWQANWVKEQLEKANLPSELILTETIGDKKLDTSISKIGSKGVFTQELEEQLADSSVDIAVHSAKDLASTLPDEFEIIAYGPREQVADVLITTKEISLDEPMTIGTSSTRRIAQLAKHFPHLSCTSIRGNLQTRIEKLNRGDCDALLLAKAGVVRMELSPLIKHEFPLDQLTPAAGQGSIAIEIHSSMDTGKRNIIRTVLNDPEAERMLLCERAFLKTLEGGCSIPVFANATLEGSMVNMQGGILSLDGKQLVSKKGTSKNPEELGNQLAKAVLIAGGDVILAEIKKQLL
ncbi:MAG: hydroxymethylbilane synthase [Cytophagales bacterium]|nr:hydroxymethylbilane synthase [Cytophagales bacterium]